MRQLRLKEKDAQYSFLFQGLANDKSIENIRKYITEHEADLRGHSFCDEPIWFEDGDVIYKVGFVSCIEETVISLPDQGSVFASGSKGGFIVAAECKNKEIR